MTLGIYTAVMSLGNKQPGSGILNLGPCTARDHPKLSHVAGDDQPRAAGVLL